MRVGAAGLNRADLLELRALVERRGRPDGPAEDRIPLGRELAGEIVSLGPGVDRWGLGERVMGRGSGFAELALIDADSTIRVPAAMSWEEAAALPVGLLTMHDALRTHGGLRAGQTVLINAATSGVGIVGIQLASLLGATTVIATSRSSAKLAVLQGFVSPLDANLVGINSSTEDVTRRVREVTGKKGVDIVVDNVGASMMTTNLAVTTIGGRIIQVGRLGGTTDTINLDDLARKRIALIGVTFRTRSRDEVVDIVGRCVADVGEDLVRCRPRIDRVFPLRDVSVAMEVLAEDNHVGKLVVVP